MARRGSILQAIAFLAPASGSGDRRPSWVTPRSTRSRGASAWIAPPGLDKDRASWWDSGIRALAFSALLLLLAACEDSTGGTPVVCETVGGTAQHVCTTYQGPGLSTDCAVGTPVDGCPTANLLGICCYVLSAGGIGESVQTLYYSDNGLTADQAATECGTFDGATWNTGPMCK